MADNGILVGETWFHLEQPTEDHHELWGETGTERHLLKDDVIISYRWCSTVFNHASIGDTLFFPSKDDHGNPGLWKSDGTVEGTVLVKDTPLMPAITVDDALILFGKDNELETQIWKSDGTTEGTEQITEFVSDTDGSGITKYTRLYHINDYLYVTTGWPARSLGMTGPGMDLWRLPLDTANHIEGLIGDSNHDGIFNSSDLIAVFQAGEYEDGNTNNSGFEDGDWNGDGEFDSSDLVAAFQAGSYVAGPNPDELAIAIDAVLTHEESSGLGAQSERLNVVSASAEVA